MFSMRALLFATALSCACLVGTHAAQAQVAGTLQVTKVKKAGKVTIGININGKVTTADIDVAATDTPADVAKKIADAFKADGVTANGNTATLPIPNGQTGGFGAVQNPIIDGKLDLETPFPEPPPPPKKGVGMIEILPNPDTGLASLPTDTTVTAGFAGGIGPVTFTAAADTTDTALVLLLNGALDTAGYMTSLVNDNTIEVYNQGMGSSTEFDLALDPIGTVPDTGGLSFDLLAVPEPASLAVLGIALAGLVAAGRRRQA